MIRLFVALELPQIVRAHLTMLGGGVPGADIDDALATIRAPRFTLELAGVGEFGGKNPRALWAGVRPNEALLHLQKKVEAALSRIAVAPDERKFSPHVTLARMKSAPREKVIEFLSHHALYASAPFAVERFVLFSGQLGSGGSVYHPERLYPLN